MVFTIFSLQAAKQKTITSFDNRTAGHNATESLMIKSAEVSKIAKFFLSKYADASAEVISFRMHESNTPVIKFSKTLLWNAYHNSSDYLVKPSNPSIYVNGT